MNRNLPSWFPIPLSTARELIANSFWTSPQLLNSHLLGELIAEGASVKLSSVETRHFLIAARIEASS